MGLLHKINLLKVFYLTFGIHSEFVFNICKVKEGQLSVLVSRHGKVMRKKKVMNTIGIHSGAILKTGY